MPVHTNDEGRWRGAHKFDEYGGQMTIDRVHYEVHEGEMWNASFVFTALADNGTADMYVLAKSELHTVVSVSNGGNGLTYIFEGVSASGTASGSVITGWNMNRTFTGTAVPFGVGHTPTLTDSGTGIVTGFLIGGAGGQRIGGALRNDTEWVLPSGKAYLFRLVNKAGGAATARIGFEAYEG